MIRSLFDSGIKVRPGVTGTYRDQLGHEIAWSAGANLTLHSAAFLTFPSAFLTLELNREFNNSKVLIQPYDHDPNDGGEYELVEKTFREDLWDLRILLNFLLNL